MTGLIATVTMIARQCIESWRASPIRPGLLNSLIFGVLVGSTNVAGATPLMTDSGVALREQYASLGERLRTNPFGLPLVLDSTETADHLQGDVYAIVAYPLSVVSAGLGNPDHWCDVMILHINTKYCHAVAGLSGTTLNVNIGSKKPEELAESVRIEFKFNAAVATPDHIEFALDAKDGPLGTSDYHIRLEAVALPSARTFLHLTYSYAISLAGRLAVKSYLGTVGSAKVGFTVNGKGADGQTNYIDGVRGMVERNTMRYFLAIDSFLGAADSTPEARLEHRLQSWFSAVERYPRQLHEMDRETYLKMKRTEYQRQQIGQ
jgi:hypothetical protein